MGDFYCKCTAVGFRGYDLLTSSHVKKQSYKTVTLLFQSEAARLTDVYENQPQSCFHSWVWSQSRATATGGSSESGRWEILLYQGPAAVVADTWVLLCWNINIVSVPSCTCVSEQWKIMCCASNSLLLIIKSSPRHYYDIIDLYQLTYLMLLLLDFWLLKIPEFVLVEVVFTASSTSKNTVGFVQQLKMSQIHISRTFKLSVDPEWWTKCFNISLPYKVFCYDKTSLNFFFCV